MDVDVRDIVNNVEQSEQWYKWVPRSIYAVHGAGKITQAWERPGTKMDSKIRLNCTT